jgi:hypothetical protein
VEFPAVTELTPFRIIDPDAINTGKSDSSTMSTGAKAGIGVGVAAAIALAVIAIFLFFRHRRKRRVSEIADLAPGDIYISPTAIDKGGSQERSELHDGTFDLTKAGHVKTKAEIEQGTEVSSTALPPELWTGTSNSERPAEPWSPSRSGPELEEINLQLLRSYELHGGANSDDTESSTTDAAAPAVSGTVGVTPHQSFFRNGKQRCPNEAC